MQNDGKTDETKVETQDGQAESVEDTDPAAEPAPQESAEPKTDEGVVLSPAEFRHYKKWKASQGQPQVKPAQPQSVSPQLNVEETVLLAQGMPEELVNELKAVAKVRGVSLLKAQNDPIFVAVKEKFEKDQKQKDASLPASRGSGSVQAPKTFTTPGLSREEHRRMVLESR